MGTKIGRQRKTGWSLLTKIRAGLLEKRSHLQLLFSGETEADEAWFGRKENQEIVMGIVQREPRRVYVESIPDVKEKTLWPIVRNTIKPGSLFCTDMRISYSIASIHYHHATTNHSAKEFGHRYQNKEGEELWIHSNTIEQLWGQFK
jgi:transposase